MNIVETTQILANRDWHTKNICPILVKKTIDWDQLYFTADGFKEEFSRLHIITLTEHYKNLPPFSAITQQIIIGEQFITAVIDANKITDEVVDKVLDIIFHMPSFEVGSVYNFGPIFNADGTTRGVW